MGTRCSSSESKSLEPPLAPTHVDSLQVAFSSIHIRRGTQLAKLLEILRTPENTFASHITSLNIRIATPTPDLEVRQGCSVPKE